MLFNSYFFVLVFLPVVLLLWWGPILNTRGRLIMMVAASYLFYGWWDFRFVSLLLISTLIDYTAGQQIVKSDDVIHRRLWLSVSLVGNLGLLAYFKYAGFMASSVNAVVTWLHLGGPLPVPDIILPVGISFYTFQTLTYSVDLYRRNAEPATSVLHFAAYVALFPQLVAGPIVRYTEVEGQLRTLAVHPDWPMMARGCFFLVVGMCQKILLADTIAAKINPMWADSGSLQLFGSWYAALGYTCQLYFDFAGYSTMAVGLGLMLGFDFPQNFDSPYKSTNISEFWRKWHMTLSFFLRDYLFIPLGGSRKGFACTLRNLMIVMLLGGLWHGAGWTFVVWGGYHGLLLVGHVLYRRRDTPDVPRPIAVGMTFVAVVFGWVMFRATDIGSGWGMVQAMVGVQGVETELLAACGGVAALTWLATLLAICFFTPNVWQIRFTPNLKSACILAAALVVCILRFSQESPFLYFQF